MRVLFLGTGGYHPNERRHTAGILLPELGLLFDAGTGLFRLADHVTRDELAIFLSHAHLDHVCGLTYLLVPLHQKRIQRLDVYGTAQTLDVVRTHLFDPLLFPVLPACRFIALDDLAEIRLSSGGLVTHCRLTAHPGGATGYRVEWSDHQSGERRMLAYVTDTMVDGTYVEFVRNADLLIHECYFPDDQAEWARITGHSHTTTVARLAAEANVQRLLLTHIDPQHPEDDPVDLAAARAIFPRTELADDLMEVHV
jgi:ribonuclease BN (tRNA processing enzyme)